MKFSIALITKNEAKTLPKLMESLKDFQSKGGEVVLIDTGSEDDTVKIAKEAGCKVEAVGKMFIETIDEKTAKEMNEKFVVEGEEDVVKANDTFFNYSAARNYAANACSNDMVSFADADEAFTKLDIDKINKMIEDGINQFEYHFVFAHDDYGNEAVKFVQSKFYDRRLLRWVGKIHEVLQPKSEEPIKRVFIGEDVLKLEHWQNESTNRTHYLKGLAIDCFYNQDNDRNSHYFAREMLWCNRPKSAIKEFERHIKMNRWPTEQSQSYCYMGDCYGQLNDVRHQLQCYATAFWVEGGRREPLLRAARAFFFHKKYKQAICYARASLEIGWNGFYSNDMRNYTVEPHELLYQSYGWTGNIPAAQYHLKEALCHQPLNSMYLRDLRYYHNLPVVSIIIPTMGERPEGLKKCLDSIKTLNYPQELIETLVIEDKPRKGMPIRLKEGVEQTKGEIIVFASDDTEFLPDSIIQMYRDFDLHKSVILVSFNSGEVYKDEGNICEHFGFRREALDDIGGEIFDTDFNHLGVDNLLWAKCKRLKGALHSERAKLIHNHWTKTGKEQDNTYKVAWGKADEDRALLKVKLAELEAQPIPEPKNYSLSYDIGENKIEGWMSPIELQFLYQRSKRMDSVCEIGSWMGRSTHALLTSCKGEVHSVDTFMGSENPLDTGHRDVFDIFKANVGHFKNLHIHRKKSVEGAKDFEDNSMEMVFIDAGHQYHEVKEDIIAWRPKATKLLSGHDYNWHEVAQAVDEMLGRTECIGSIWYLDLTNPLHKYREMIENNINFTFAKMGDGEMIAMLGKEGENCDGQKYTDKLKNGLREAYRYFGTNPDVKITKWKLGMDDDRESLEKELGIKCTEDHDLLLNRSLTPYAYNFLREIKRSRRRKIYIGNEKLKEVKEFLSVDEYIEVPAKNATEMPKIELKDNDIIMFSAGMVSEVWMAEYLKQNKNITCIDFGSAFDSLFIGQTRTNQQSQEVLKNFFKDLR